MYIKFDLENMITIGVILVAWMLALHIFGQVFQYAKS